MKYYCGIDLHSNNLYMCVIDDNDKRLVERKLPNDSQLLIAALSEYRVKLVIVSKSASALNNGAAVAVHPAIIDL